MALPPEEPPAGVPEWVVTYGDMMSLLLTFFIMLVSMSTLKQEGKLRAAMDGIRQAFGATDGLSGTPGTSPLTNSANSELGSKSNSSDGGVERAGRNSKGLGGPHKSVERINHGTVISLGGATAFGPLDARLTDDIKASLDIIAHTIGSKPNLIVIRGHATPQPVPDEPRLIVEGFEIRDPFDLSFARARAVAQYLIDKGIDHRRISVSSAGDSEPRKVSKSKTLQDMNGRVDVFLIDSYLSDPNNPAP